MHMVNSELQPLVSNVASGLGGDVTLAVRLGADAATVSIAVWSKSGVVVEQGGAMKVGS